MKFLANPIIYLYQNKKEISILEKVSFIPIPKKGNAKECSTSAKLHSSHVNHEGNGERNGNPLQCSCLENPRDGEPGGLPSMGSHRVGHN